MQGTLRKPNSFQDLGTRVRFLNKFYQCLFPFRFPQKIRKLVLVGPKDCGKTTWANVLLRVVPQHKVASITKESQFSASMINNETELVIIDEWSRDTLTSDSSKIVLQGGWMVTAVKHGTARSIFNNCRFYITANAVPDYRDDEDAVNRRIANEIEQNIDLVEQCGRWYEDAQQETMTVANSTGMEMLDVKMYIPSLSTNTVITVAVMQY